MPDQDAIQVEPVSEMVGWNNVRRWHEVERKNMTDTIKQVIVMRNDLGMRKGKMVAQGAHAAMAFLLKDRKHTRWDTLRQSLVMPVPLTESQDDWIQNAFTKICVQVDSEEALREIHAKALRANLEAHLIVDNGKTEFNGVPTATCCAIGPDLSSRIDPLTGHLKLF